MGLKSLCLQKRFLPSKKIRFEQAHVSKQESAWQNHGFVQRYLLLQSFLGGQGTCGCEAIERLLIVMTLKSGFFGGNSFDLLH